MAARPGQPSGRGAGSPPQPVVVGYLLPEKVAAKLAGCLESDDDVTYVRLDPGRPLGEQGPVDVLLHKLVHEMALGGGGGGREVEAFARDHPRVVVIDALHAALALSDRSAICAAIRAAAERGYRIAQPRFAVISDASCLADEICRTGLTYPVILKPLVACGAADTHTLCVVWSEAGAGSREARAQRSPLLAQELVPHDGVMVKGYAVGRAVHSAMRPSLPAAKPDGWPDVLVFDSQQPLGQALRPRSPGPSDAAARKQGRADPALGAEQDRALKPLGPQALCEIAQAISEAFGGLQLFGFDVVVERGSGRPMIVDVNSLPHSAQSFPGLPRALKAVFIRAHERQRLRALLRDRWAAGRAAGEP
ncbi:inositol-tetrakisphosphate 1-kinase [Pavlovales sp. CCMP2436]|nr:inositol-tetrakisphosphate 1-kinase [Pavlovales sp. CCMP2436]